MIIRRTGSVVLLLISFSLSAATIELPYLKVGPLTYSNVTIIGANATDVYFNHDKGIGNAKLKYLSPELQKRLNYDPNKAAEAENKKAEADALYTSTVASNIVEHARAARTREAVVPQTISDPISDKSLLGKAVPDLAVDQWVGDKPNLDGKYLLVAFWEPWSAASVQSVAQLNALQKKFTEKLVVVGISTNSEAELAKAELAKASIRAATDSKGKICAAAGVTSIPSVLLVDPKGIVRYQGHPAALSEQTLQNLFSASE